MGKMLLTCVSIAFNFSSTVLAAEAYNLKCRSKDSNVRAELPVLVSLKKLDKFSLAPGKMNVQQGSVGVSFPTQSANEFRITVGVPFAMKTPDGLKMTEDFTIFVDSATERVDAREDVLKSFVIINFTTARLKRLLVNPGIEDTIQRLSVRLPGNNWFHGPAFCQVNKQ
jgi:hypothetical protein